jgi:hypothetical protein
MVSIPSLEEIGEKYGQRGIARTLRIRTEELEI